MTATAAGSPAAADPELSQRFAEALARLWPAGGTLGLAVSGGPDSLAMLLLAHAAIPGRFEVATVDHGLRAESAAECALVQSVCDDRAIACVTLKVSVAEGNLQSQARSARYEALGSWAAARGLSAVATAHHADDQAETLLMRLNRGSGVAGLAGIRAAGPLPGSEIPLIRPLLGFRRAELAGLVAGCGLVAVQDPSNTSDRFDRARLRKAIGGSDWLDPEAIVRSAANLADADEALDWAAAREWAERVSGPPEARRYRRAAPRAVALRIIERAVRDLGGQSRGLDVARLLDRLEAGSGGNIGGVLVSIEAGGEWVFRPEPPRRA